MRPKAFSIKKPFAITAAPPASGLITQSGVQLITQAGVPLTKNP